ncbi:MAG TPA: ABC transporter substrate-binding protein [Ilumatobacter sp.]|nr:ABC transporter substrate-binding protein [Ilumatobacter sp.]
MKSTFRPTHRRRLMAAIAACGLAAAACGSDSDSVADTNAPVVASSTAPTDQSTDDTTTAGTAETAETATSEDATVDTESGVTTTVETATEDTSSSSMDTDDRESDPDATLIFTYAVPNGTMDPAKTNTPFDLAYMRPVYDTLMVRGEDGNIGPGLATDWEFEDDSLLITLRTGVAFHDGTPFDADAVKANLDRQMSLDGGTQKSFLASVASVEVVDAQTVRLVLQSGAGALVAALTGYPGMMVSPAVLDSDLTTTAVGTGPYTLVKSEPGVEAVYARYDGAWNPDQAGAAELKIITNADAGQRLNQLKSGDAHAANMDPNLIEDAEAAGMQVLAKPANNMWLININTLGGLSDPDARRAISLAIDREALVEGLDFGYGTASSQILPPSEPGSNADVVATFDPDAARELASSSGLAGKTLVFLGAAIPTITGYQEALQAMLGEVGINVEIRSVERAQVADELIAGNWDLYMNFFPGSADPWLTYNAVFGPDSVWFPGEAPAEVVSLLDDAENETDPAARIAIFEELAVAVDELSLVAVIAHPERPVVAVAEVTDFLGNVHAVPQLRGSGIAAS